MINLGREIFWFPFWWYGQGLLQVVETARNFVRGYAQKLAFKVWVKNIFTPMFGRYDWQSRIISGFMRLMNIIGRGFLIMMVSILASMVVMIYLALPLLAAGLVLFHFSAGW